jgi:hypothetical protein
LYIKRHNITGLMYFGKTYGGNGTFQSLVSGEPVETNLVLRFREIETLHQGRIADGL